MDTLPYIATAAALFVSTAAVSLLVVGLILSYLPADYFHDDRQPRLWTDRRPALRYLLLGLKNLAGVGLIVTGVVLSVPGIPGQGLLTILIGIMLLDLPGKRRLERWWVSRPRVLRTINRFRRRCGKAPLRV